MDKILEREIDNNKISHAYFIECFNEDQGKQEAEEFAAKVLGKKLLNNPDYKVLVPEDGKTYIAIDQIRELQKDVIRRPLICEKKVYLVPQAAKLNPAAQNCLLKTLEEPPAYVVMILCGPSVYSVIPTVRSRVKKVKIEADVNVSTKEFIRDIIDNIHTKNKVEVLKYAEKFENEKSTILEILHEMISYSEKRLKDSLINLSEQKYNDIINYGKYIEIINSTELKLKNNANFSMQIDKMLLDMKG